MNLMVERDCCPTSTSCSWSSAPFAWRAVVGGQVAFRWWTLG
jgi:hypothetical protein